MMAISDGLRSDMDRDVLDAKSDYESGVPYRS